MVQDLAQELPQRLLIPLLKYAVDKGSVQGARMLVEENPRGVRSTFVTHNIGKARMQWLREKGLIDG